MYFENFEHGRVAVGNGDMHYRVAGSGQTVVLLHGWPQHSLQWHAVAPLLAERYRVVIPDLPGCGGSSIPKDGLFDKRTIATALHKMLETLGLRAENIVGYDHGGGVGYSYACLYPEEVARFALVEYALPGSGVYEAALTARPEWNTSSDWQLSLFTVPDVAEFAFRGRERELLTWFFTHDVCNPFAISNDHLQQYTDQISKPGALRAGIGYYASIWQDADMNKQSMTTKLTFPVLGVGGRAGIGEYVRNVVEAIAENPEFVLIEQAGHFIADEQPAALAQALLEFFV